MKHLIFILFLAFCGAAFAADAPSRDAQLAAELHPRGWIAFSAQTLHGDWDLFLMRPDGSERRALTDTREFNEAGARFSPDGKRLLYYRMASSDAVDNNTYGTFDLVLADSNGGNAVVYGRDFPWASWSSDGRQLACLTPKGIQIIDVASRQIVRTLARQGIVQQLVWSPDGKAFVATANGLGAYWNIGRLADGGGKINAVSETERYNCTPDWCPDSRHILYARGISPKQDGRAQSWLASDDRRQRGNRRHQKMKRASPMYFANSTVRMADVFKVAAGILPAVEPGILPGGMDVWFEKSIPLRTSGPGGKMPPATAAKMAAVTD